MKNTYTATQQKELFAKDCKLINLKYEYTGYIEQEKWAIVSELSEQELFEKYPDEVKKYIPFVLLSVEQGKAIQAYNRNEDKYRKRQNNNSDAFGYDDGTTENMHSEVSVPDFIEQQEMDDYYNRRAEEKMRLFVTAMASLTEKQHKYLVMRYVDGISARDIAKAEGVAHQVVATLLPDIAAEWSDRNYPLLPTQVTVFANRKAWWKCKDCGREWNTLISTRSGGSKCPYCSGYIFLKGFNDLQTTHPEIASEWSEKNLPLKPDEVNAKSRKNVWWRCGKCGNEWKSVINARVKGTVCPVCAEREVLAGYNDLATTDNQLLSEWDYEQNKLKPTEVSRTSAKRAWWKCRHGHSWSMKINERTILNKGCRICEQEYLSLFPALAVSYYSNKKGLKAELGSDRLLGVPLETYIPSEKLAIESGSADENIEIMKAYMCEQRGIRLIKLPMKGTELDYADSLKRAFQSVHIFISSDTEEDVEIIKNTFERWRDSQ